MEKVITFIAGFIVGVVVIYSWGQIFNKDGVLAEVSVVTTGQVSTEDGNDNSSEGAESSVSSNKQVEVSAQPAGNVVSVSSATLTEDGWIVVHEVIGGVVANALGAMRAGKGVNTAVTISLLRGTTVGSTYAVVLYNDKGDREFSLVTDRPLTNESGAYIMSTFVAQ